MSMLTPSRGKRPISAVAGPNGHPTKVGAGQLALSAVARALLLASGWLGGMLAHRFGVPVADETTQADGFGG